MKKVIVITGGTSGIGLSAVNEMVKKDCVVYELSRRPEGVNPNSVHIPTDVTNEEQVKSAIKTIIEKENHIDVLINNAGYGISGAIEFTDLSKAKQQFDVNFFGLVAVTAAVLPYMRQRKSGRIINISSIAALVSLPFQAFYSATKAAVKSYTLSLANETRPFGIEVCTVLPGDIKTGFTQAREKNSTGDEIYSGRIARCEKIIEKDEQTGMNSDLIGKHICKLAFTKKIRKPISTVGIKYKFYIFLTHILSERLINRIIFLIYAK